MSRKKLPSRKYQERAVNRTKIREMRTAGEMRSCGTCTACCTVKAVKELDKPVDVQCEHVVTDPKLLARGIKGCGLFGKVRARPGSCSSWSCAWRIGALDAYDRPDRLGVVVELTEDRPDIWGTEPGYVLREAFPGGFERAGTFIDRLKERRAVILVRGKTRTMLGPPYILERAQEVQERVGKRFLPMLLGEDEEGVEDA